MTYSPALLVHLCAGILAVASGSAALVVRKGSRLHRRSGIVFSVSMLFMSGFGAYLGMMKGQRFNILAGTFTFYLVATAWLTIKRRSNETGRLELILLLLALTAGTTGWIFAWQEAARLPKPGKFGTAYFIFGLIAFSHATGDLRVLVRGGVAGAQRLMRHIWRMGFALFIAAGSLLPRDVERSGDEEARPARGAVHRPPRHPSPGSTGGRHRSADDLLAVSRAVQQRIPEKRTAGGTDAASDPRLSPEAASRFSSA